MTAQDALDLVAQALRETIQEDWIADFPIDAQTRFNEDLELESIEFVRVAQTLGRLLGRPIDLNAWLGALSLQELLGLTVGQLAEHLCAESSRS